MTAVDVDALDKLRSAATPGPWEQEANFTGGWSLAVASIVDADEMPVRSVSGFTHADAALIVAAVNALPDLLAEVRRGRALREAVTGLAEQWLASSVLGLSALAGAGRELRRALATVDGEQ